MIRPLVASPVRRMLFPSHKRPPPPPSQAHAGMPDTKKARAKPPGPASRQRPSCTRDILSPRNTHAHPRRWGAFSQSLGTSDQPRQRATISSTLPYTPAQSAKQGQTRTNISSANHVPTLTPHMYATAPREICEPCRQVAPDKHARAVSAGRHKHCPDQRPQKNADCRGQERRGDGAE